MSTSLLYHGFAIRGYRYRKTDYVNGDVAFTIEQARRTLRCSVCGSAEVESRGSVMRVFQSVPIGKKRTFVHLAVAKARCRVCGAWRQVAIGFADPKRRHTRAFDRYALELTRSMTIQDVADHLGTGWDRIKEIQKRDLQRRFAKPRLKEVRQIAIDEISVGKGHQYRTVVLDLESGAIVFVGKGKEANSLKP